MQVVRPLLPEGVLCAGSLQAVVPATARTSSERYTSVHAAITPAEVVACILRQSAFTLAVLADCNKLCRLLLTPAMKNKSQFKWCHSCIHCGLA